MRTSQLCRLLFAGLLLGALSTCTNSRSEGTAPEAPAGHTAGTPDDTAGTPDDTAGTPDGTAGTAGTPDDTAGDGPGDPEATPLPAQGTPCNADGECAEGLTCVEYYGVAGASGPKFTSCEIPCTDDPGVCPEDQRCAVIADGPGQVCRSRDEAAPDDAPSR